MASIIANVTELELADGERIFIAPTKTKDVVTLEGSVLGGSNMLPKEKLDAVSLAVDLLDAGTSTKTKDQIRETLSSRGIALSFSSGGDRTYFSGSCLPEDLPILLQTIVECLSGASFPAKEIARGKERLLSDLNELKTNTRGHAARTLMRHLYAPSHVNYPPTLEERIAAIPKITRNDLVTFRKLLGRGGLVLSVVGDISVSAAERAITSAFKKQPTGTAVPPEKKPNTKKQEAKELLVPIKDKANIDTLLGVATPMNYDHPLYVAFFVFCSLLGGRDGVFSGHLMRTIRERDGLTYGIYVINAGFGDKADGAFRILATFSPATFKTAVAKTREEVAIFLKSGLTAKALLGKQDQLVGSYLVGMSTTDGLASALHGIGIEGKPLSYLDTYLDLIRAVTVDDLKAVAKLIPFDKLSLAASGSFEK